MPSIVAAQSPDIRRVLTPVFSNTVTTEALEERNGQATLRATNTPFTGIVLDRWPNGRLKLLRSVENGKATGLWTEWYDTGVIRYLAEWHPEGSGEGAWFYFHENGVVRDRTVYRRDIPLGPSEGWHANGRKAFAGVYDSMGRREGVWRWWGEDGQIDREVTFAGGQAQGLDATWRVSSAAPCTTPCRLAPGVISTNAEEFRLVFAPAGDEAFLTRREAGGVQRIYVTRFANGRWSEPTLAPFSTDVEEELAISADGNRVVFASRRPADDAQTDRSDNLWSARRKASGWSDARMLPRAVNRVRATVNGWPMASEFAGAILTDGSLMFWTALNDASNADLFLAPPVGDSFGTPVALGPTINTSAFESAPAVSPDGRWLVFQRSGAPDGAGQEDLYVAERTDDGWGPARLLDAGVSTKHNESFPSFTPDGQSLLFASDRDGTWSVYVVSARAIGLEQANP